MPKKCRRGKRRNKHRDRFTKQGQTVLGSIFAFLGTRDRLQVIRCCETWWQNRTMYCCCDLSYGEYTTDMNICFLQLTKACVKGAWPHLLRQLRWDTDGWEEVNENVRRMLPVLPMSLITLCLTELALALNFLVLPASLTYLDVSFRPNMDLMHHREEDCRGTIDTQHLSRLVTLRIFENRSSLASLPSSLQRIQSCVLCMLRMLRMFRDQLVSPNLFFTILWIALLIRSTRPLGMLSRKSIAFKLKPIGVRHMSLCVVWSNRM